MPKEPKSFSLDEQTWMLLERDETTNHSALVEKLIKSYYGSGDMSLSTDEIRLRQVNQEIEERKAKIENHEDAIDRLLEQRDQLEESVEESNSTRDEAIEEAAEILREDQLEEENPAVRRIAAEGKMDPAELVEEVKTKV